MNTPYYTTIYFQVFIYTHAVAGIITAFATYKVSKKNKLPSIILWTITGLLIPIIPYFYLKYRYKE